MAVNGFKKLFNPEELKPADIVKASIGLIAGIAADVAIAALFRGCVPVKNGITKVMFKIGTFAIALKVGEDVEAYINKMIDDAKKDLEESKKAIEEAEIKAVTDGGE